MDKDPKGVTMKNLIFVFIILWSGVSFAQEKETYAFKNYVEMRAELGRLFQQKEYEKAAKMIEWALSKYPGHVHANSSNLALVYLNLENFEKAWQPLNTGMNKGYGSTCIYWKIKLSMLLSRPSGLKKYGPGMRR